jgi:hypothetical protein
MDVLWHIAGRQCSQGFDQSGDQVIRPSTGLDFGIKRLAQIRDL